ncbi:MAG: superoxide dismutase [Bacteroidales bacterium]|nr:superoxide dismutase [Bacteroidales bacterium]
MIYTQPDLPYAANALAPVISADTINFHYGKHEKAYIDNLNNLLVGSPFENDDLEDIIRNADNGALLNNAAQAWNHIFYFFSFSPDGGGSPSGNLANAINRDFGSFDSFQQQFEKACISLFGSGWVWLAYDSTRHLHIIQEPNAGNPLRKFLTPLLTFDVWEHAYYLDYQNRRADAIHALWDIIDWPTIQSRF